MSNFLRPAITSIFLLAGCGARSTTETLLSPDGRLEAQIVRDRGPSVVTANISSVYVTKSHANYSDDDLVFQGDNVDQLKVRWSGANALLIDFNDAYVDTYVLSWPSSRSDEKIKILCRRCSDAK